MQTGDTNLFSSLPGRLYLFIKTISILSNIVTAGGTPPNAVDQARHFFMGLDKTRYEGYTQYVLDNERQAIGVFPVTIADVIAGAESFLSTT